MVFALSYVLGHFVGVVVCFAMLFAFCWVLFR